MIRVLVHLILATILATSVYYAVKNFKHLKSVDENEADANVVHENIFNVEEIVEEFVDEVRNATPVNQLPEEELFQPDIDIVHIIPEENLSNNVIADRFVVDTMIARGRVGTVWNGFDQVGNSDIAIKFAEPGVKSEVLEVEYQNYLELGAEDRTVMNLGIPQVLYFGTYGGYKVLVTSLLGKTLHELKESTPKNKFSLNTVLKIAMQMMDILKYVHSRGLLLSDIRSSNLAIGHTEETLNKIFALDFASCVEITSEARPVNDLLGIGFVLLELNGVKFPPLQGVEEHRDLDQIIESLLNNWNKAYVKDLCAQSEDYELFYSYFEFLKSLGPETKINHNDFKEYFEDSLPTDARNTNLEIFEQI